MTVHRIAIDVMGGDHGPRVPIAGALDAARSDGVRILLVGREEEIGRELASLPVAGLAIDVVPAAETIEMAESPVLAVRRKRNSSIAVAARLVRDGQADAMVSAGNTGAVMATAILVLRTIPGIDRPALTAVIPNQEGRGVLLDVGANIELKPIHYLQFAGMGHLYSRLVLGVARPRIGLLSIGEEEGKGPEELRRAFEVLRESGLRFIGNIEGKALFNGDADVIVCDGFTGNVSLKVAESTAEMVGNFLRAEAERSWLTRIGFMLARPAFRRFRERVDYAEYGGVPLLGINGCVVVCHGRSSSRAIRNAVRACSNFLRNRVVERIREEIPRLGPERSEVRDARFPRAADSAPGGEEKG